MEKSLIKMLKGYAHFRRKYAQGDQSVMQHLSHHGQQPDFMVVACCDSRVDPALILQCDPGDLFVARNVANIVPPFVKDEAHHGTSAALEFGICFLKVKHLVLLGHSQCGGIQALIQDDNTKDNDFITNWVSIIKNETTQTKNSDDYAKLSLHQSYKNCLTFPWIQKRILENTLRIHRWYFDIKSGEIFNYSEKEDAYLPLSTTD